MNWLELLSEIFTVCIIPLLGVLTTYLVKYTQMKIEEIKVGTENTLINKYLDMLSETITSCVIATNQTYVEALKKEGKFDAEAQRVAFDMTKTAVMAILTEEAKEYLAVATGDLNTFISQQIEAAVNSNKFYIQGAQ